MEAAMERNAADRSGRSSRRASMGRISQSHRSLSRDINQAAGEEVAVAVRGEDVFVHQLHRRACLLNKTFQVEFGLIIIVLICDNTSTK